MEAWYMDAFAELSTCRQLGMARGPIPWRDIVEYARFHRLDDAMFPVFHQVIRSMDSVFLDWHDGKGVPNRVVVRKGEGAPVVDESGNVQPTKAQRVRQRRTYNRRVS